MEYKEYAFENGKTVELSDLRVTHIDKEDFIKIHENTIIVCVDIMIWYNGGFLLIQRDNYPAKKEFFCIGGRLQKGIRSEDDLKRKVMEECNLGLKNIKLIGASRQFYQTDPFGHSKGTDSLSLVYYAEGIGDIKLDNFHSNPLIVDYKKFQEIKDSLHPFIKDFLYLAFKSRK